MIKIHKLASYTWVEVISPTKEELRQVTNDYQTPVKFQSYMMDRHEQPRATYDELSGFGALVVRAIADQSSERMLTMPIFLGFSNTLLVTVCHDEKQGKCCQMGLKLNTHRWLSTLFQFCLIRFLLISSIGCDQP